MENTNQIKRGGKLLLGGFKFVALAANVGLGFAGDSHEWLADNFVPYAIANGKTLKQCAMDPVLAAEFRSYMVSRFREIIVFTRKIEDLNPEEQARLAEIELQLRPRFSNDVALKCKAFDTLMRELDS